MRTIKVGPGPEDFVLQEAGPRGPRLIISSRKRPGDDPGTILSMDLADGSVRRMTDQKDLRPVGISLVGDKLYVIDSEKRRVERFRVEGDKLVFDAPPLADPLIGHANDLVALESGEIYLTNWKENNVIWFDGKQWHPFAEVEFANGIAVAGERLFVNSFKEKQIVVLDRKTKAKVAAIHVPAHPDNLLWEVPGKILNVAAVKSYWKAGLQITTGFGGSDSIGWAVYVETGALVKLYDLDGYKGSSTALAYKGNVYLSQAVGDEIAVVADPR